MKKTLHNKRLSKAKNILRRVLSKTSNLSVPHSADTSKSSSELSGTTEVHMDSTDVKPTINVEAELLLLKQQINSLQIAVSSMQHETEKKEVAIANLAREKERLASDLRKQQRSYTSLKQQLEEEREFYYREKEQYCQEMNDCKKLKKSMQRGGSCKTDIEFYKKEATKLKASLTQTLEANYNLSVKFLRMKNTKYCIKNRLKKLESIHGCRIEEYNLQMEVLKSELVDVVNKELQYPIPPSNKKYLQIIKQNGILTHDNLCLRLEVDRLNLEIDRLKMLQIRNETNFKLKYINSKTREEPKNTLKKNNHVEELKEPKPNPDDKKAERVIKANDRNNTPPCGSNRKHFDESPNNLHSGDNRTEMHIPVLHVQPEAINLRERHGDNLHLAESSKFEVVQLSENPSQTSTHSSEFSLISKAVRTQSAPEIVQTSLFVNIT